MENRKFRKEYVTDEEWNLIETIRNYKRSMHNPSLELEWFARQLFENMLYDNDNE